jgi:hypothetical protein
MVHGQVLPVLDLDNYVKGGWSLALKHSLLRAPPAGLFIAEGHRLDAAHQIAQGRVLQQVVQGDAVGGTDQLHPALGNRARRGRLQLAADLVDDDHLGHVVLHRFDHHLMLVFGLGHLHTPGPADSRMGDVAIAADLVGGIDHHDALFFG